MPDYADGKVTLTEAEKAIVRGMNGAIRKQAEQGLVSNIGAVHFDGPVLRDMLEAHRELTERFRR